MRCLLAAEHGRSTRPSRAPSTTTGAGRRWTGARWRSRLPNTSSRPSKQTRWPDRERSFSRAAIPPVLLPGTASRGYERRGEPAAPDGEFRQSSRLPLSNRVHVPSGASGPCAKSSITARARRLQVRRGDFRGHRDTAGHGIPDAPPSVSSPGTPGDRLPPAVWSHADACVRTATRGFGSESLSGCLRNWNRFRGKVQKNYIFAS